MHPFITNSKMFSFPPSNTHTQSYMHTPSLKGLVGYQQPPSLGVQGIHTPPGEDMSVWALPVPVLLPTICNCTHWRACAPWRKTHSWGVGAHVLHPAVPPNELECSGLWQLLGRLLCPTWAVVMMPWGDVLQCQTSSDCCCFHCKVSPLLPVEYFNALFRFLFQLSPLLRKSLCLSHRLLFNPIEGWLPL